MSRKGLLLLSCAAGLLSAGAAFGQTSGADDPKADLPVPTAQRAKEAAAKSGVVVEELVVTGVQATEDPQTIPQAATVYNASSAT